MLYLTITDINKLLTDYLNGENDARRRCFIPSFLPKLKYPLFKYNNTSLTPAGLYEAALERYKDIPKKIEVVDNIRQYSDWLKEAGSRPDVKYLRSVFELKDYADKHFSKDELVGFYIYGSVADFSYVYSWSDLDTLVILKKEPLKDLGWLRDLKRRLVGAGIYGYLFNPLQAHLHVILTEYDMNTFDKILFHFSPDITEHLFEITSFNRGLCFYCINADKDLKEKIKTKLKEVSLYYKKICLKVKNRNTINSFEAKTTLMGVFNLLKILASWEAGEYFYCNFKKAQSILNNFTDFNPKQQALIEKALLARQRCLYFSRYPYTLRKNIGFLLCPNLLRGLHYHFDYSIVSEIYKIMGNAFLDDVLDFIEEIERRIS